MRGLGTIINVAAIVVGGLLGLLLKKALKDRFRETIIKAQGFAVIVMSIGSTLSQMFRVGNEGKLSMQGTLMLIVSIALGALFGELINIDRGFEKFGEWLKVKTGNSKDAGFVDGFLTASFTVCIGAMAVVGSIEDSLYGDISILLTKGILDMIIVMVMAASMGKGPVFSFIPVFILQGLVTALAKVIEPVMNDASLLNLSMIGSIMIFCVGINLVWGKRIKVANLLPALIFAVAAAWIPWFN